VDTERTDMRIAEKIIYGVALLGLLFKIQHWPLAGILLVLGLNALAIVYFPLAALWFGRPTRRDQVLWFSIFSGFGLSVMLIGLLFKLQHWPMANAYLLLGTVLCAVIALLCLLLRRGRTDLASYFRGILWRASILGGLGALSIYGRSLKQGDPPIEPVETAAPPAMSLRPDWAKHIAGSNATGVFVLFEPDSNTIQLSEEARAFKGFLPASTFKVFYSLVALQEKAVADERAMADVPKRYTFTYALLQREGWVDR